MDLSDEIVRRGDWLVILGPGDQPFMSFPIKKIGGVRTWWNDFIGRSYSYVEVQFLIDGTWTTVHSVDANDDSTIQPVYDRIVEVISGDD